MFFNREYENQTQNHDWTVSEWKLKQSHAGCGLSKQLKSTWKINDRGRMLIY